MANAPADTPVAAPQRRPPLKEQEAADYLNYSQAYMRLMRQQGRGPAFIRIGRSIRYDIPDLDKWQLRHRVTTREAK